ncbi:MAG TPA: HEAT repeat domain-containing protein [Pirellulales bacterium]|nr:HEAT repeat domain-containing protein [Pirellulales bacterium]
MSNSRFAGGVSVAALAVCLLSSGCGHKFANQPAAEGTKKSQVQAAGPEAKVVRPAKPEEVARLRVVRAFRDWGVRETAADALARIGDASVPSLVEILQDPDRDVRAQAARALARMGPRAEPAIPALIAALNDSDKEVRMGAARALGQIGPPAAEAVPDLIQALKDPRNKPAEQPEVAE